MGISHDPPSPCPHARARRGHRARRDALDILAFDPATRSFQTIYRFQYPFGDARMDSRNVAFYLDGRFGDAIFDISRIRTDPRGRVWVSDFLSGHVFILERAPVAGAR